MGRIQNANRFVSHANRLSGFRVLPLVAKGCMIATLGILGVELDIIDVNMIAMMFTLRDGWEFGV